MASTNLTFASREAHRAWLSTQAILPAGFRVGTARFEYQHPIATYAMCEDYALTRYAPLKPICAPERGSRASSGCVSRGSSGAAYFRTFLFR